MGTRRRLGGALATLAASAAMTLASAPAPAGAAGLAECAQQVIRDWYSGGRVDDVYPLACYRAAIRSLPSDVLAYSNADQDIRRAMAFAQRSRSDPGDGPAATGPADPPVEPAAGSPVTADAEPRTTRPPEARPVEKRVAAPTAPVIDLSEPAAAASVPYPIIALAGLSALLLGAGAIGWVTSRRAERGDTADR
jgi:hypothetical protein